MLSDPVALLHEIEEEVEDLGFDGDRVDAAPELAIEHVIAEREEHRPFPTSRRPSNLNKKTKDS